MDGLKMRNRRIRRLNRGRIAGLGWLEAIGLRIRGWVDGARGLPRRVEEQWSSPFLSRELNSYEEFCSRMWSMLQLESEGAYIRLNELTASLPLTLARIDQAREELRVISPGEAFSIRKTGEEELSEDQVRARRANERKKELEPMRCRLTGLQNQLREDTREFTTLCCRLAEDDNTTRMAVHRVRDHIRQRMDVYWNAAMSRHSDHYAMPNAPTLSTQLRAEQTYLSLHAGLMLRAEQIRALLEREAAEKEAS